MNRPMDDRIPVIGGGVAGLVAAAHLAERGLRPLVLEADPERIGGRLQGGDPVELEHAGQRWCFPGEHGIHGIWSSYLNFKALLSRYAILPALVPAQQETWVFGKGAHVRKAGVGRAIRRSPVPAPFHYLNLLLQPGFLSILTLRDWITLPRLMGSFLGVMSIDPILEQKALRAMTLADFTAAWSPRMRSFFAGLARNALAAHPEQIPATGFIAFLRFYTLLRRDAWDFSYLPGTGGACVTEPLAGVVQRLGGQVALGCRVVGLEREQAGWRVRYVSDAGQRAHELLAPQLVMALDAPAARALLLASPATAERAASLHFPSGIPTAIFRLWFGSRPKRVAEAGIFSGDFVIDNFFWMDRLQDDYRAWAEATGGSAVETHIYGPAELLAQPDAVLMARVQQDLSRAFPELRGQLLRCVMQRNQASHTLFSVGDPEESLGVETPWPGLIACGDWLAYPHPALYLERASVSGIAAANAVLAQRQRAPWPILPAPQPEWLAGKIQAWLSGYRQALLNRKRRKKGKA